MMCPLPGDAPSECLARIGLLLGSDWTVARGGQETSIRSGGTIWVTSETALHINKRPGSRDMAAASVMSVLLMATERNRWQLVQGLLLLLPPWQRSKRYFQHLDTTWEQLVMLALYGTSVQNRMQKLRYLCCVPFCLGANQYAEVLKKFLRDPFQILVKKELIFERR
ncbi:hypothetical protein R6Z07F_001584 [Ovis aries]